MLYTRYVWGIPHTQGMSGEYLKHMVYLGSISYTRNVWGIHYTHALGSTSFTRNVWGIHHTHGISGELRVFASVYEISLADFDTAHPQFCYLLCFQGDACNYLYFLCNGSMEILKGGMVVAILGKKLMIFFQSNVIVIFIDRQ